MSVCALTAQAHFVRDAAVSQDCMDPALRSQCTAQEVDTALRRSLKIMDGAERNSVLWFGEMNRRSLYRDLGYSSIHQYASEALGFSANRTYRFLRLVNELDRLPKVRASLASGEIGWTKAREIVKVAGRASQQNWIDAARRSSSRELENKVRRARKLRKARRKIDPLQVELQPTSPTASRVAPTTAAPAGVTTGPTRDVLPQEIEDLPDDSPATIVYRLNPLELARYEALHERVRKLRIGGRRASREEVFLMAYELLAESVERPNEDDEAADGASPSADHAPATTRISANPAATDSAAGKVLPRGKPVYRIVLYTCEHCHRTIVHTNHGTKQITPAQLAAAASDAIIEREGEKNKSTIPPSVRGAVMKRDHYRCRARGCRSAHFLEVHHIVPRDKGGSNRVLNLVTLCSACHQLWHERGPVPLAELRC